MHVRKDVAEGAAVGAAAMAVAVTYGIYAVHPWQGAPALNQFLAEFGRADTTAWPARIVCYAAALVMVGLALWPARRWSSPLICGLAAAYFAWIGIGYFAWLSPGMHKAHGTEPRHGGATVFARSRRPWGWQWAASARP